MADYYSAAFGLGSNLGARLQNLRDAADRLARAGFVIDGRSGVYETEPWGVADQPCFLNACVRVSVEADTSFSKILRRIKKIERGMGRVKSLRWGPRLIDIDLLLFGSVVFESDFLTVPHKEMLNRAFVLYPLADILPQWRHPVTGESAADAALRFPRPVRVTAL